MGRRQVGDEPGVAPLPRFAARHGPRDDPGGKDHRFHRTDVERSAGVAVRGLIPTLRKRFRNFLADARAAK